MKCSPNLLRFWPPPQKKKKKKKKNINHHPFIFYAITEMIITISSFYIIRFIAYSFSIYTNCLYCMAQSNMRHRLAKHSHVIDKHFSMLPSPELRRRNIDRYHTFFHANKWQTELAILSLQTCMLTVLAAHWLFIARTVQWIRVALRRTVQWIRIALRTT